jgi:3-dehydroquinate dehydratase-2
MTVLVLNGPNLRRLGLEVDVRQTNHEGDLLDWLNNAADDGSPVILNAGAWSHYSYALFDACGQLTGPLVEVHISDPSQRPEEFRHTSVVSPHAATVIAGHGIDGYREALEYLAQT